MKCPVCLQEIATNGCACGATVSQTSNTSVESEKTCANCERTYSELDSKFYCNGCVRKDQRRFGDYWIPRKVSDDE